jgi:arylsulfatase
MDNGWSLSLLDIPLMAFNKSIIKYPNIKRFPGGASNDLLPDLQHPENPVPALDVSKATTTARMGGD